jgi:hypothetical protein
VAVVLGGLAVGPSSLAAGNGRFQTHLTLLEELTRSAVCQALDSLEVPRGETIFLLAGGNHEGNGFVGDVMAAELIRRGCTVRVLEPGMTAGPPASPADGTASPAAQDTAAAFPDTTSAFFDPDTTSASADSAGSIWDEPGSTADDNSTAGSGMGSGGAGAGDGADAGKSAGAAKADSIMAARRAGAQGDRIPPRPRLYPEGRILEYRVLEFGVQYPQIRRRYLVVGPPTVRRLAGVYLQASWIQGPGGDVLDVASGQSHYHDVLSGRSVSFAEGASYPFQKPEVPPSGMGRIVEPIAVVGIITSLVYLFYQNQN